MHNKELQRNFRITKEENNKLHRNAQKANLSVSSYLRMMINGYVPKAFPPIEYDELMIQLNNLVAGSKTGVVGNLSEKLYIDRSNVYRRKEKALEHLTVLLYGY